MPAPAATKAAIQRAIEAAQACRLRVTGFTVGKDGSIRLETSEAATPLSAPESVDTPPTNVQPLTPKKWANR